jgi:hypothetical protein
MNTDASYFSWLCGSSVPCARLADDFRMQYRPGNSKCSMHNASGRGSPTEWTWSPIESSSPTSAVLTWDVCHKLEQTAMACGQNGARVCSQRMAQQQGQEAHYDNVLILQAPADPPVYVAAATHGSCVKRRQMPQDGRHAGAWRASNDDAYRS